MIGIEKIFAADATTIVGTVTNDQLPSAYQHVGGITVFLTNVLSLVFVAAGVFAFINLILAGFQFMSAGGDPKAIEKAFGKIWQSLLGLIIVVGSFALASLIGYIIFGNASFILSPQIYGPGQ